MKGPNIVRVRSSNRKKLYHFKQHICLRDTQRARFAVKLGPNVNFKKYDKRPDLSKWCKASSCVAKDTNKSKNTSNKLTHQPATPVSPTPPVETRAWKKGGAFSGDRRSGPSSEREKFRSDGIKVSGSEVFRCEWDVNSMFLQEFLLSKMKRKQISGMERDPIQNQRVDDYCDWIVITEARHNSKICLATFADISPASVALDISTYFFLPAICCLGQHGPGNGGSTGCCANWHR